MQTGRYPVLTRVGPQLGHAAESVAVGGFLILWLMVWPFWLVLHRR
jgi:hypothetical protein